MESQQPYTLKSQINPVVVAQLAADLKRAWSPFDRRGFENAIVPKLDALELKERANLIADCLHQFLPDDYPQAAQILVESMKSERDKKTAKGFTSLIYMAHSGFIATYGLDNYDASVSAICALTKRFTAEFCVRPFIVRYPEKMMQQLHEWATDDNEHVRRLVSEGTRPRLPWAGRLPEFQKDPTPVIALLEKLKADPELYVRRSVANNLNDIVKDHPDRVVDLLLIWNQSNDAGTKWIVKHATRTLIKQGHPGAMRLLGFSPDVKVVVSDLQCDRSAPIGGTIAFSFAVTSAEKQAVDLVIDFAVHYVKSNGKQSPKVFKLAQKKLAAGATAMFQKNVSLVERTTRKHYPGLHHIEVQINGQSHGKVGFEVTKN